MYGYWTGKVESQQPRPRHFTARSSLYVTVQHIRPLLKFAYLELSATPLGNWIENYCTMAARDRRRLYSEGYSHNRQVIYSQF